MYLALAGYRGEGKLVKDAVLQTERRLCYGGSEWVCKIQVEYKKDVVVARQTRCAARAGWVKDEESGG
jgi:hypothetical protein